MTEREAHMNDPAIKQSDFTPTDGQVVPLIPPSKPTDALPVEFAETEDPAAGMNEFPFDPD
jgi:hypothetical protein